MNKKPQQQQNRGGNIVVAQQQMFSGPIPDPESLAKYEEICPGSADRILSMAEKEGDHRRNIEKDSVKNSIRIATMGIIFAFFSVVIISFLVYYSLRNGFNTTAGVIAVGAIASVASVFVFFNSSKGKNKSNGMS